MYNLKFVIGSIINVYYNVHDLMIKTNKLTSTENDLIIIIISKLTLRESSTGMVLVTFPSISVIVADVLFR